MDPKTEAQNQEGVTPEIENVEVESPELTQEDLAVQSDEAAEVEQSKKEEKKELTLDDLPLPGDEEPEKEHEKNWPKGFKERLQRKDKILAKREAENNQLKQQLSQLSQNVQQKQAVLDSTEKPKRENYADDESYFDDLYKYNRRKEELDKSKEMFAREVQRQQEAFEKQREEITNKGVSKYEDYEDVTEVLFQPDFPANRPMYDAIVDSEHAPDILYFLAKYPDEAKKIAQLPPVKAIKKVAEIEARFEARKKANVTKNPRVLSPVNSQSKKEGMATLNVKSSTVDLAKFREKYKSLVRS